MDKFFRCVWQTQPCIFRAHHTDIDQKSSEDDASSPLRDALAMNWDDIADLLHNSRTSESPPLFFQNGEPITDPHTMYAANPHAAYIDGCSVILNHADFHHKAIANLCNDLQSTFPHVYANSYLTPPRSHAVEAHADDRDVLVIQILGSKVWKVYKKVPVEYPFEREQVGKNGNKVDESVFKGGLCFDKELTLYPGDVLYMPRGFVHEATTEESSCSTGHEPSFHVTVAIATHDWSLSVMLSETIRKALDSVTSFRQALPIGPCDEYQNASLLGASSLKHQLDEAMSEIQSKVTPELLEHNLQAKYQMHNKHANEQRQRLLSRKRKSMEESNESLVGYNAASKVTLSSVIRVSTPEERSSVTMEEGRLRGLTVREETMAVLMEILGKLKRDPSETAKVGELRELLESEDDKGTTDNAYGLLLVCDFTLLSFVRCCVELGALAIVE